MPTENQSEAGTPTDTESVVEYGSVSRVEDSQKTDFEDSSTNEVVEKSNGRNVDEDRQFDKGIEFLLSCMGMSVGLGNIWRFPTRAYENGGSAFLIAYLICAILFGLPAVYLEFALGQYQGRSPPFVYRSIMPALEGFGWVAANVSNTVSIYFMLIISWISVYMFNVIIGNSGKWSQCDNEWNDPATCFNIPAQQQCQGDKPTGWNSTTPIPKRLIYMEGACRDFKLYENITLMGASEQYFTNFIIRPSTGLTDFNSINWQIIIAMIIGWILTVLAILKGMKFVGKLSYVTVTLPYILILVMLIRGVTLDGASDGLKFFLVSSDFSALWKFETWTAALTQLCFSLGIGFGALMNIASYNNKKHNCYRDAIYLIMGDTAMSLFGGAAVFSTLGFLAKLRGVAVSEVISSGPSLAFIAYPDAMNQMPLPWLWNFLFFFMLFSLGISSEFVMVEVMCSCIIDRFPRLKEKRTWVVSGNCLFLFVAGLVLTTDAGIYWFELFDEYGSGFGAMISATTMCIIVSYIYGKSNFRTDIISMLGDGTGCFSKIFGHNSTYFAINWKFISPIFGIVLIVLTGMRSYPYLNKPDVYPPLFDIFGWMLAISPFLMVPFCAYCTYTNFKKEGIPTRGIFLLQKSHPSYLRISSEWSDRKQEIGSQLPSERETSSMSTASSGKNTESESGFGRV